MCSPYGHSCVNPARLLERKHTLEAEKPIQVRGRFCDRGVATPFWKVGMFKGQICLTVTMNGIYEDICIYLLYN